MSLFGGISRAFSGITRVVSRVVSPVMKVAAPLVNTAVNQYTGGLWSSLGGSTLLNQISGNREPTQESASIGYMPDPGLATAMIQQNPIRTEASPFSINRPPEPDYSEEEGYSPEELGLIYNFETGNYMDPDTGEEYAYE